MQNSAKINFILGPLFKTTTHEGQLKKHTNKEEDCYIVVKGKTAIVVDKTDEVPRVFPSLARAHKFFSSKIFSK